MTGGPLTGATMIKRLWNRCDVCGRIIALKDFDAGAVRRLVSDDTAFSSEKYRTLCVRHGYRDAEGWPAASRGDAGAGRRVTG